jgi:hypothetical protein
MHYTIEIVDNNTNKHIYASTRFFQEIGIQPKNNHIFRFNPNPQAYDSVLPLIRVSFKYAIQMILYILQGDRI